MIEKRKNLNKFKLLKMIMLKIRKDVSYIIQLFYTTYKEVTVRDVILLIIDILNFKNNLFFH